MPTNSGPQNFIEATDIFGRFVRTTNFLLDNWWVWIVVGIAAWLLLRLRANHAILGHMDERCEASLADIDALLAERHALIGNLVETVKGFAVQEQKILKEVTDARARAMESVGQARLTAETQIGQSLTSLFALSETYPDISSSSHFRELRLEMTRIEDRITAARRFYNLAVEELNATRRAFPGNLIALVSRIGQHEKFTLGEGQRAIAEPVKITF